MYRFLNTHFLALDNDSSETQNQSMTLRIICICSFMDVSKEATIKDFMRRCGQQYASIKLEKKEKDLTEEEITQYEKELTVSVISYDKPVVGVKVMVLFCLIYLLFISRSTMFQS